MVLGSLCNFDHIVVCSDDDLNYSPIDLIVSRKLTGFTRSGYIVKVSGDDPSDIVLINHDKKNGKLNFFKYQGDDEGLVIDWIRQGKIHDIVD